MSVLNFFTPDTAFLFYLFAGLQIVLPLGFALLVALVRRWRTKSEAESEARTARIRSRVAEWLMVEPGAGVFPPELVSDDHTLDALQSLVQAMEPERRHRLKALIRNSALRDMIDAHLHSPVWWKRLSAIRLLQFLPMDEFKPRLDELQHDPQPLIRLEALRAISGFSDKELARVIGRWPEIGWMLDHHPIDAAQSQFGGPSILELEELIDREPTPDAMVRLVELIPRLGGSVEFLMEVARHEDIRVRLAAIRVMAGVQDDEVRRELIVGLEDKNWRVRAISARSLAKHKHPECVRDIAPLLLDKDARVKLCAAYALKQLGPGGEAMLRAMSKRMKAPEHRRMFAQALGLPIR